MLYGVQLPKHKTVSPANNISKLLKMRCSAESRFFYSGGKGKLGMLYGVLHMPDLEDSLTEMGFR